MRTVIAHDYLTQRGGAERVALALGDAFPGSPFVTSVYEPDLSFPEFRDREIVTGPLQHWPGVRRDPRKALPLLAPAWDRTAVTHADVVVASTSGWAHGVGVPDGCALVAYCHNPARWLYQTEDYLPRAWQRAVTRPLRRRLEAWDRRAAQRVDTYVANSSSVAARIERVYGRPSTIVHPPVSIDVDGPQEPVEGLQPGFFLTVGRGRGYKNVRAVIDGVGLLGDAQVAVVGSAPRGEQADAHARWLGVVSDAQLRWLYANARALVAVSYEDFGLTPIEANAFGTPVAVLRAGGYLDSTHEGVSGVFIDAPLADAVAETLRGMPELATEAVVRHAARFSQARFAQQMHEVVAGVVGDSDSGQRLAAEAA